MRQIHQGCTRYIIFINCDHEIDTCVIKQLIYCEGPVHILQIITKIDIEDVPFSGNLKNDIY